MTIPLFDTSPAPAAIPSSPVPARRLDGLTLKHLSPSSLSTYDYCPAVWHTRYVLNQREPRTVEMAFGTAVHLGLSAAFLDRDAKAVFADRWEQEERTFREGGAFVDPDLFGRGLQLIGAVLKLGLQGVPDKPIEIHYARKEMPKIIGFLDLYDAESNTVIDFKTATIPWSQDKADGHMWQPCLYSYAIWQERCNRLAEQDRDEASDLAEVPTFQYVVLPKTGAVRTITLDASRTKEQMGTALFRAKQIALAIQAGSFPCQCGRCGEARP